MQEIPVCIGAAILSGLLPASCFCSLCLAPVSWSSLCHIFLSCPYTWTKQCSNGSKSNWEDRHKGARTSTYIFRRLNQRVHSKIRIPVTNAQKYNHQAVIYCQSLYHGQRQKCNTIHKTQYIKVSAAASVSQQEITVITPRAFIAVPERKRHFCSLRPEPTSRVLIWPLFLSETTPRASRL